MTNQNTSWTCVYWWHCNYCRQALYPQKYAKHCNEDGRMLRAPKSAHLCHSQSTMPRYTFTKKIYLWKRFSQVFRRWFFESNEIFSKSPVSWNFHNLQALTKSILFQWHKMNANQMFVETQVQYAYRNFNIPIRELGRYEYLVVLNATFKKSLDYEIKKLVKVITGIPPNASNAYLHTSLPEEGVGHIATDAFAMCKQSTSIIINAVRMNCFPDNFRPVVMRIKTGCGKRIFPESFAHIFFSLQRKSHFCLWKTQWGWTPLQRIIWAQHSCQNDQR